MPTPAISLTRNQKIDGTEHAIRVTSRIIDSIAPRATTYTCTGQDQHGSRWTWIEIETAGHQIDCGFFARL